MNGADVQRYEYALEKVQKMELSIEVIGDRISLYASGASSKSSLLLIECIIPNASNFSFTFLKSSVCLAAFLPNTLPAP